MPMIGLMPAALRPGVEVVGPEHVAVVGHRERRHAHPGRLGEQLRQPGRAVEHGVLGVHVQMHERVAVPTFHGGYGFLSARRRTASTLELAADDVPEPHRTSRSTSLRSGIATRQSPRTGRIGV